MDIEQSDVDLMNNDNKNSEIVIHETEEQIENVKKEEDNISEEQKDNSSNDTKAKISIIELLGDKEDKEEKK